MPIRTLFKQLWHERRAFINLLVGLCLVTGFLALGPIYTVRVAENAAVYIIQQIPQGQVGYNINQLSPINPEIETVIDNNLSGLYTTISQSKTGRGATNNPTFGNTCGFDYIEGEQASEDRYRFDTDYHCYTFFAVSDIQRGLQLVDGRFPDNTPQPSDERFENPIIMGEREVEGMITATVAENVGLQVGDRLMIGNDIRRNAVVEITGIVEPTIDRFASYWRGKNSFLSGVFTPYPVDNTRYDFGIMVPSDTFDVWISPIVAQNEYSWEVEIDSQALTGRELSLLENRLDTLEGEIRLIHVDINLITGLQGVIDIFNENIAEAQGPVLLLSIAILVLLLYNLITTAILVSEQRQEQQAIQRLRGASAWQLTRNFVLMMSVPSIIAFILSPILAMVLLWILEQFGPLANIGGETGIAQIPASSLLLSFGTIGVSILVLALQVYPSARNAEVENARSLSRPSTTPLWARYYLDLIILIIGFGLIIRLYFLISGDLGESLTILLEDPTQFTSLMQDSSESSGINDPFNIVGPFLIITGGALLWLRIFPYLMQFGGWVFRRQRSLLMPMAFWNIERAPTRYAQLVLVMIGTLGLGTAALSLNSTNTIGAENITRYAVGGDAQLTFIPSPDSTPIDWSTLEGIENSVELYRSSGRDTGNVPIYLTGLTDDGWENFNFDTSETKAILDTNKLPSAGGVPVTEDVQQLILHVQAEVDANNPIRTILYADIRDGDGQVTQVVMETITETLSAQFAQYWIDTSDYEDFTLDGFRFASVRELDENEAFEHEVFIDALTLEYRDGSSDVVVEFENDAVVTWQNLPSDQQESFNISRGLPRVPPGTASAQINYFANNQPIDELPLIKIDAVPNDGVPVVISSTMAAVEGRRTSSGQPLAIGDSMDIRLTLDTGIFDFNYQVVGIVDSFPTFESRSRFFIMNYSDLLPALLAQRRATPVEAYAMNTVLLDVASDDVEVHQDMIIDLVESSDMQGIYAWEALDELQREPVANATSGMLFAGFIVSLSLGILSFALYLIMMARRRSLSFAILQAMGWSSNHLWRLLLVEQLALLIPAIIVGVLLGIVLGYMVLPFLSLSGTTILLIPIGQIGLLVFGFMAIFLTLIGIMSITLGRLQITSTLRQYVE